MAIIDSKGGIHQYRGGKKQAIFLQITPKWLSKYLQIPMYSVRYLLRKKIINPTNIETIVDYKRRLDIKKPNRIKYLPPEDTTSTERINQVDV